MSQLLNILNADLHEIVAMHLKREDRSGFTGYFVSMMKHYFTGDVEGMKKFLKRIEDSKLSDGEKEILICLANARVACMTGTASDKEIDALRTMVPASGPLRGEFFCMMALCYEKRSMSREMSDCYLKAFEEFKEAGVNVKAVKTLFNHIAAEHRLHPDKKFLSDYQYLYRESKKCKAHGTAAMALVNISREYQLIGGYELALKNVNRALALVDRERYARAYFMSLAHRAHVLLEMGRKEEALEDFREAQLCTFLDVRTSLESLKAIFAGKKEPDVKPALMSWEGRVAEVNAKNGKQKLGALEEKLLQFLADRPRTRWEMIDFLYGSTLAPEVLENRFNNTFQRLKKKLPGLIVNTNGKFSLAESLVEFRFKKNA